MFMSLHWLASRAVGVECVCVSSLAVQHVVAEEILCEPSDKQNRA